MVGTPAEAPFGVFRKAVGMGRKTNLGPMRRTRLPAAWLAAAWLAVEAAAALVGMSSVSYTHLTLPTIYSV